MSETARPPAPRYLEIPHDSCLGDVANVDWRPTIVVRVGDHHIGLRANVDEVGSAIRDALAAHLIVDPWAGGSFAIHRSEPRRSASRPVFRVLRDCNVLFATPSLPRAVAALAGFLDGLLPVDAGAGRMLELDAVALVGPRDAVLASWSLRYRIPSVESRLRPSGIRMLERMSVLVDPVTREVVVPDLRLTIEGSAMRDVDSATAVDVTASGRRRIRAWLFEGPEEQLGAVSRAEAVARGMSVAYRHGRVRTNLERLATLARGIDRFETVGPQAMAGLAREILNGDAPS